MSVLYETDRSVFISHSIYVENVFKKVLFNNDYKSLRFKNDFFEIESPFLRENEAIKHIRGNLRSKKKRKVSHSQYSPKIAELAQLVKKELTHLTEEGKKLGLFESKTATSDEEETNCVSGDKNLLSFLVAIEDGQEKEFSTLEPQPLRNKRNCNAKIAAEEFYRTSWRRKFSSFHGTNNSALAVMKHLPYEEDSLYLFPQRCCFHCCDVRDIITHVKGQFDMVVVDPPWWNKFIRRKNAKCIEAGYQLMTNEDLGSVPLGQFLNPGALVAVWCTNSESNMKTLEKNIFPQWGLDYIGRWFWVKVTKHGDPVCDFHPPPGRQPFEQIVFGRRLSNEIHEDDEKIPWEDGKVIASVPSAIHSHKPPLSEVLKPYLKKDPQCLELFARYLLPGWTSVGLEVLKLQHLSLYEEIK